MLLPALYSEKNMTPVSLIVSFFFISTVLLIALAVLAIQVLIHLRCLEREIGEMISEFFFGCMFLAVIGFVLAIQ